MPRPRPRARHPWLFAAGLVACSDPAPSAPATTTSAASTTPAQPAITTGTLRGVVTFTGKVPEMKVPKARKDADLCRSKPIPHDAVLVKDGKLKDVLVRLAPGSVMGVAPPRADVIRIRAVDCTFQPRMQGGVTGQRINLENADATLHNFHNYYNHESLWGSASPKGAPPLEKELPDDPFILKLACDVHPWERAFVVVTDHPFFAVTGEDGAFRIDEVPAGDHRLEAWHSQYGLLTREHIPVRPGAETTLSFTYDGTTPEPDENRGELTNLW